MATMGRRTTMKRILTSDSHKDPIYGTEKGCMLFLSLLRSRRTLQPGRCAEGQNTVVKPPLSKGPGPSLGLEKREGKGKGKEKGIQHEPTWQGQYTAYKARCGKRGRGVNGKGEGERKEGCSVAPSGLACVPSGGGMWRGARVPST